MSAHRYAALGMAVVLVVLTLVLFSDESMQEDLDMTGIVSDIREGANGYTFTLNTYDGGGRCFFREARRSLVLRRLRDLLRRRIDTICR